MPVRAPVSRVVPMMSDTLVASVSAPTLTTITIPAPCSRSDLSAAGMVWLLVISPNCASSVDDRQMVSVLTSPSGAVPTSPMMPERTSRTVVVPCETSMVSVPCKNWVMILSSIIRFLKYYPIHLSHEANRNIQTQAFH